MSAGPSSSSAAASSSSEALVGEEHCYYCFDVLEAALKRAAPPEPRFVPGDDSPLFVTWNTITPKGDRRLRGCIGTFGPVPLESGLADYAKTSAFKDHRFNPIAERELASLECGISLLTPFEPCADYTDWTIGEHGIYIHVPSSSGRWLTATYLPDVIPEQGWSKREAVDSAIRKAGHTGSIDEALRRRLKVERYRSEKCSRTYEQWRAARA